MYTRTHQQNKGLKCSFVPPLPTATPTGLCLKTGLVGIFCHPADRQTPLSLAVVGPLTMFLLLMVCLLGMVSAGD